MEDKKTDKKRNKLTKTFQTQPISQPDKTDPRTNIALPNDENVEANRNWVNMNKK